MKGNFPSILRRVPALQGEGCDGIPASGRFLFGTAIKVAPQEFPVLETDWLLQGLFNLSADGRTPIQEGFS